MGDYQEYSIGLSTQWQGLDLSASYLFNSIDDGNEVDSGPFRNDDILLLSLSRSF